MFLWFFWIIGAKVAKPFEIELETSDRTYRFVAESDADRDAWITWIKDPEVRRPHPTSLVTTHQSP